MIPFNGKIYNTAILSSMSNQELVDLFNQIQAVSDGEEVSRFSDRETGMKRVTAALRKLNGKEPGTMTDTTTTTAEKAPRKVRAKHFNFPVGGEIKASGRADTLRTRVRDLLLQEGGATFDEVIDVVKKFDGDRKVEQKNVERRAYEVVRILHYYLNYGLKQDAATGKITLVEA